MLSHPSDGGDNLWHDLAERCAMSSMRLWSPSLCCYIRAPDAMAILDAAAMTSHQRSPRPGRCRLLCFRTRETATELRVRVVDGELPPHVTQVLDGMEFRLLALSQYRCADGVPLVDALRALAVEL